MIVIDRGAPVGFVVDRIDDLLAIPADGMQKDDAGAGSIDPDLVDGVVKGAKATALSKYWIHDGCCATSSPGSASLPSRRGQGLHLGSGEPG